MKNRHYNFWFIIILIVFICLNLKSAFINSITFDETSYIGASVNYIYKNNFEVQKEHPPLIKMLLGINKFFIKTSFSKKELTSDKNTGYFYGYKYLFEDNKNQDKIIYINRLIIFIFNLFLFIILLNLIKKYINNNIFLIFSFFTLLSPTTLAYSNLIITDIAVNISIFISLFYLYLYYEKTQSKYFILFCFFSALSISTKATAVFLLPTFAVADYILKKNIKGLIIRAFVLLMFVFLLLDILYLFYNVKFFIPFQFFKGIMFHLNSFIKRASYLNGQISNYGWWYYSFVALFYKLPLIILMVFIFSIFYIKKLLPEKEKLFFILFIFSIVYVGIYIIFGFNLGIRHLLIIVFFIYFVSSCFIEYLIKKKKLFFNIIIFITGIVYLLSIYRYHPYYITYFNELVKKDHGYKILLDSNYDWGQGLKGLNNYLIKHNIEKINISYFGVCSIKHYIKSKYKLLPGFVYFEPEDIILPKKLEKGYYAISGTNLYGLYLSDRVRLWMKANFVNREPIKYINGIILYKVDK